MSRKSPAAAERNRERGAVVIIIVALWMTLFGLAALAIDIGFLRQNSRSLQTVADSAVMAGLRVLPSSQSTAIANATMMTTANGYSSGVTVTATSTQLTVVIAATQPRFFGAIFGMPAKTLHATSIGRISPPAPAIVALGGCGTAGLTINGGGVLNINGIVESNGPLSYSTGPASTTTTGAVQSACAVPSSNGPWNNFPGGRGIGGPFANPFAAVTTAMFACTVGSLGSGGDIPGGRWVGTTLLPGVYCSSGDLNLNGPGTSFIATGVTLVSLGHITIGANGASTLSAAAGAPNNIVAYALSAGTCGGGPAVNVGNNSLTITGSIYAPNGCINAGGTDMTVNGSFIAAAVNLGDYGPWTFNPGGGGGGSSYIYQ
jgi:hypothetical protein